MHELSIAQSLITTAVEQAQREGATRVVTLELRLGSLCGVDPDALAFCFPLAAKGTPCEEARLQVTCVTAHGECPLCGQDTAVEDAMAPCAGCGHWPLRVSGGRDLVLAALEVA